MKKNLLITKTFEISRFMCIKCGHSQVWPSTSAHIHRLLRSYFHRTVSFFFVLFFLFFGFSNRGNENVKNSGVQKRSIHFYYLFKIVIISCRAHLWSTLLLLFMFIMRFFRTDARDRDSKCFSIDLSSHTSCVYRHEQRRRGRVQCGQTITKVVIRLNYSWVNWRNN